MLVMVTGCEYKQGQRKKYHFNNGASAIEDAAKNLTFYNELGAQIRHKAQHKALREAIVNHNNRWKTLYPTAGKAL